MAKAKKEPEVAPSLDSIRSFLYEVEKDYVIPRYYSSDSSEGLAFRETFNRLAELEKLKEQRLKELERTDIHLLGYENEEKDLRTEMLRESKDVLLQAKKLERALNVRGLTDKVLKQFEEFEEWLAAPKLVDGGNSGSK